MKIRWYKRSGERTSEAAVLQARDNYAQAKRTGRMGPLACSIQPAVAERIKAMTAIEFATYTGQFTYRWERK